VGIVFAQGGYLLVSIVSLAATMLLLFLTYWLVRKDRLHSTVPLES
jgi:hypothetical protein